MAILFCAGNPFSNIRRIIGVHMLVPQFQGFGIDGDADADYVLVEVIADGEPPLEFLRCADDDVQRDAAARIAEKELNLSYAVNGMLGRGQVHDDKQIDIAVRARPALCARAEQHDAQRRVLRPELGHDAVDDGRCVCVIVLH